ncbi:lycopene cyclase domain-containing protein [Frankia sp. AiPs1]|uniref:lycopene cyclase domain-containing protein n=1 Tax=Frankia sp. AiPs1 TaxID=573493 RepID=UPI0020441C2F|nr:lycopene cyclase domain-containing protein [Frankia sp. AiPs1]MCM3923741.1 lycopene cyclase domain-containing protein [Frankia sp. AiPs1]
MRHLSYLAVLVGCLLGTAPLELFLGTRVYVRPRRLLLTLLPVVAIFAGWDVYAIAAGHWSFDPRSVTGVRLPGRLPLDELLFFLVVPVCAVITLEAVRSVRGWPAGDEPADDCAAESTDPGGPGG